MPCHRRHRQFFPSRMRSGKQRVKKYAQGSQHLGGADVENGYMLKKGASHLMGSRIKKSAYNLIPH
jgi:hypothetical protein